LLASGRKDQPTISSSLNGAEVKALRSQMYFIYFTIGMLWALGLYFLFTAG